MSAVVETNLVNEQDNLSTNHFVQSEVSFDTISNPKDEPNNHTLTIEDPEVLGNQNEYNENDENNKIEQKSSSSFQNDIYDSHEENESNSKSSSVYSVDENYLEDQIDSFLDDYQSHTSSTSTDSIRTDVSNKDHDSDTSYEVEKEMNDKKDTIEEKEEKEKEVGIEKIEKNDMKDMIEEKEEKDKDVAIEESDEPISLLSPVVNTDELNKNELENYSLDKSIDFINQTEEKRQNNLDDKPVENTEDVIIEEENMENVVNTKNTEYTENTENIENTENVTDVKNIENADKSADNFSSRINSMSSDEKNDIESVDFSNFNSSKTSSFSSISIHNSNELTNEIIEKNNADYRVSVVSVASLRENPELNDISLDDETQNSAETPKEWSFNDWSFPKTPTTFKTLSSLFNSRTPISPKEDRRLSTISIMSTGSNYDLLLARLEKENQMLQEDPKARRMSLQGMADIKANFERVQNESTNDDEIDWDYETVARSQPRQLSKMIQKGIPPALRGMIWQLMSKSKDSELESKYAKLLKETSPHEKMIMRDLNRTFPKHEYFQDQDGIGQEGLFNVVKAYSLYDKEVGYCQGISFVVGPLLLNMPDEEAFCVLLRLMKYYNMRGHFLPGMDGLQLKLFQFDRLVEEMLPKLHEHLKSQGINSSMYASQWFMTLFAYKFPLPLVFRIYDTIFTEGIESIFRFSIALLKKNEKALLEMEFEKLLEYLKSGLFESYQIIPTEGSLQQLSREHVELANELVMKKVEVDRLNDENVELRSTVSSLRKSLDEKPAEVERILRGEMNSLAQKNITLVEY
ncbi:59_t:CDS:2 [Diversispora eburnea]|uniref:59_t:CDS:1 n=1 Tax=Diversispora eburnea TaxID=1213867 RepID=A0A9N9FI02_9GLOM|nr:59_t:CDS:2 [Diversispora eburnea]